MTIYLCHGGVCESCIRCSWPDTHGLNRLGGVLVSGLSRSIPLGADELACQGHRNDLPPLSRRRCVADWDTLGLGQIYDGLGETLISGDDSEGSELLSSFPGVFVGTCIEARSSVTTDGWAWRRCLGQVGGLAPTQVPQRRNGGVGTIKTVV